MKRITIILLAVLLVPAQVAAMTTPFLTANRPSSGTSNSAVRYMGVMPYGPGTAAGTNATEAPMPIAGTFSKLYLRFPTAIGAGTSYTVALMVNNAATSLSAQITDAGLTAQDTSNTVTVAAGDMVSFRITPSGTPASNPIFQVGVVFDATTSGESPILSLGSTASTTGTVYASLGSYSVWDATESLRSTVFPTNGVISNMYVDLSTAPGVGKTNTITLVKNGTPTSQTCTVSDTATTCTDLTNSVTVAPGDTVSLQQTPSGTPAGTNIRMGHRFVPTISGESVMLANAGSHSASATRYQFTGSLITNQATESTTYSIAPIAFTWKDLYIDFNVAPGAGKSRSMVSRIGGASQTLTAVVSDTATTANDTANDVSVAAGDLMDWMTVPTGTPDLQVATRVSAVMYIAPPAASPPVGQPRFLNLGTMLLNFGKLIIP